MYRLNPNKIYMLDSMKTDADAMSRVDRMCDALGVRAESVRVFRRDEACDVVREINAWDGGSGECPQRRRALVFTKLAVQGEQDGGSAPADRPSDVPGADLQRVLGRLPLTRNTHSPEDDEVTNLVCWNTQDFGVMWGCPHGCHYCGAGKQSKMIVLGMNIREYMDKVVGPTVEGHPGQKCFRLIGWTADIITFEPEYGAFASFLSKLAEYDDRYGYFHTASDNVDWVPHVPHRDRLIGVWSMTCEAVARLIEPGSPSAADRIEAARKCQAWGVPVRYKLKPMIPVRNWREEYAQALELIFDRTQPESIGFCVLMWMNLDELEKKIDLDLLDPKYVAAAHRASEVMKGVRTGPFPHPVRAEIYRFLIEAVRKYDRRIPLYISTESREMWDELADDLGQNPRTFICGCNPIEAPGPRMMPSPRLCASTYFGSG